MEQPSVECLLEAVLFVAEGPVDIEDLAKLLDIEADAVIEAALTLASALASRGLRLARTKTKLQLVSAPETAEVVKNFLGIDTSGRLSNPALETLAIVAYRQPVTRAQIDAIRGVSSDGVMRTLLAKSLVTATGRLEQAGRPVLYGTTFDFLQYFGISSLEELPSLPQLDLPASAGAASSDSSEAIQAESHLA